MPHKKVGQPLKHIVHNINGRIVDGLKYDDRNDTYYAYYKNQQGENKKKNFGRDKTEAIRKFLNWQDEQQGGKLITVIKPSYQKSLGKKAIFKLSDRAAEMLKERDIDEKWFLGFILAGLVINEAEITEQFIFSWIENKLQTDPLYVAQKLKLPGLANPELLKDYKPKKSYTLTEIGDNYFNKVKFKSLTGNRKLEFEKVKTTWERFCRVVKVTTITELTKERIKAYYEDLYSYYLQHKLSTTWLRGFQERVMRVLNAAIKELDNSSDIKDAKVYCSAVFKIPTTKIKKSPQQISKEAFQAILDVSNTEEKAMWLVLLNLAYYVSDLIELPLSNIDFKSGAVIFDRTKNDKPRAGVLWPETLAAIKNYLRENPHKGATLFYSHHKAKFASSTISKKFKDVITRAKKINGNLSLDYTPCHFRDSFQSVAAVATVAAGQRIEQRAIDAVMGHTNQYSAYTIRTALPEISQPAIDAVRNFYFANNSDPKTKEADKKI